MKIASSPYFLTNYIEILSTILKRIVTVCFYFVFSFKKEERNPIKSMDFFFFFFLIFFFFRLFSQQHIMVSSFFRSTMQSLGVIKLLLNFILKRHQGSIERINPFLLFSFLFLFFFFFFFFFHPVSRLFFFFFFFFFFIIILMILLLIIIIIVDISHLPYNLSFYSPNHNKTQQCGHSRLHGKNLKINKMRAWFYHSCCDLHVENFSRPLNPSYFSLFPPSFYYKVSPFLSFFFFFFFLTSFFFFFSLSVCVSMKYFEDDVYSNKYMAKVGGISTREVFFFSFLTFFLFLLLNRSPFQLFFIY